MHSFLRTATLLALVTIFCQLNLTSAVSIVDFNTGKDYEFINTPTEVAIDTNIKISTNVTSVKDGDYINVLWTGVTPTTNRSDYLAVITPGDDYNYTRKAPSKYIRVSD